MNPTPLLAALQFEGVQRPLLWTLGLAVGAGMLYWAYREIFHRTERRLTWALLGLRAVGLVLLVLALAKPVWTRESEQVEPGHVAVILDTSRSMSLPYQSGQTRYAAARAAAERLQSTLERGSPKLVVDFLDIQGTPLRSGLPERPTADRTDLVRAVREATTHLRGRLLTGIVLLSDGMDNTGRQSFRDLEDVSVPIHALGFPARESADLDLAVRKPVVPERTIIHNELRIEVPVSKEGQPAATATVTLKRGREVLAKQTVPLPEGRGEQLVPLTFTPKEPGSFVFTAAVESEAGEKYLGNNAVNFPIRVDNEPIGVLYVEGFLRYEYKFLKARLEDDPDLALVSVVRLVNPELPEARGNRALFAPEQMKKVDVVILGDMEGKYLTAKEYQDLLQWLDGKNHSLLVLGGYHSFGPEGFRGTPLADVLPVVFAASPPFQSEEAFQLELTEKGQAHPLFALTQDRVKDAATWNEAPPLAGLALVQRTKPGAEALAIHPALRSDGSPVPVIAVQRAPGGGQVMVLTADTTWRWSRLPRVLGQSDTLYARFWSQAIRWLAGRSTDEQRPLLTVSSDRADYDVGQRVALTVTRQPRPDVDLSTAEIRVEVTTPGGETLPALPLKPDSTNPDLFKGEFTPSAGGRYELSATLWNKGQVLANQSAEFMVQGPDLELANAATNPAPLRALAETTGGAYLDLDHADQLPEKIVRKERKAVRVVRTEFWNSPWLFAAFILAVSAEWFLRRVYHLI